MDFTLSAEGHTPIVFGPEVPAGFVRNPVTGAHEYYASGDYGHLVFNEQPGTDFSLWCKQFQVKQAVSMVETPSAASFLFSVAISRSFHYQQAGIEKYTLPEAQFNIMYTPATARELLLEKGKKYLLYEIRFTRGRLEKLMPWFGLLPEFLMRSAMELPSLLSPVPMQVTPAMMAILRNMMEHAGEGMARDMYLDALLSDLLLQAMTRLSPVRAEGQDMKIQSYELAKLKEAWDYLLGNLDKPGTMAVLSQAVGLNEFKLKRGFKLVYGMTIFEFLLEARMEKATRLLKDTNMTVHAVGLAVGYKNISSFTVAYKKKFNLLPSDVKGQA